jgi:hypothetical protein
MTMTDSIQQDPRTKEEIDNEYTQCATWAGDVEFKIQQLKAQGNGFYNRMRQLQKENLKLIELQKAKQNQTDEVKE